MSWYELHRLAAKRLALAAHLPPQMPPQPLHFTEFTPATPAGTGEIAHPCNEPTERHDLVHHPERVILLVQGGWLRVPPQQ